MAEDWEGWQVQGWMMNIGQILFVGSEIFCFVFYFYIGTLFGLIGVLFI